MPERVYLSELIIRYNFKKDFKAKKQRSLLSYFPWMHLVTLFPQMPQVLDSRSPGIDLHFWGRALRATSEKIQVVSVFPKPSRSLLLGPLQDQRSQYF